MLNVNTQIGLGLAGMGLAFFFLGIMLLFDKGLLAIGNVMFLAGLSFIIGFRKLSSFFFQWHKLKGTAAFFSGILLVLFRYPVFGVIVELVGFYFLFSGFLPTALQYVTSYVPFFNVVKNRSIV